MRTFNDFPGIGSFPAFSQRAVDALEEFLTANGELLPLKTDVGKYHAYNVLTKADILDRERSQIEWLDGDEVKHFPFEINRYETTESALQELSIFRIPEDFIKVFVTQPFVDRVNDSGLKGFHLVKLWPLEDDRSWHRDDYALADEDMLLQSPNGKKSAVAETVVLRLGLGSGLSDEEGELRIQEIIDELESVLYNLQARSEADYYGSFEEAETKDREYRLFLTCPGAKILVERLRPWLQSVAWDGPMEVVMRFGEMTDPNCEEAVAPIIRRN